MQAVIIKQKGHVLNIIINRPESMNALDKDVNHGLTNGFTELRENPDLRVGIISATGEKAFSTGGDLKEFQEMFNTEGAVAERFWRTFSESPFPFREFGTVWKPLIAAVNGYCLAGGLELALCCDIILASENASFGIPEVTLALIPSAGGTQRLVRRIPFGIALEMLLTGEKITAQEALRIGLVNKVVPQNELITTAEQLAEKIAKNGPLACMAIKELAWRGGLCMPLDHALRLEKLFARINRDAADAREGAASFVKKEKPIYRGK